MHPAIAALQAFLAPVGSGFVIVHLVEMRTRHGDSISVFRPGNDDFAMPGIPAQHHCQLWNS